MRPEFAGWTRAEWCREIIRSALRYYVGDDPRQGPTQPTVSESAPSAESRSPAPAASVPVPVAAAPGPPARPGCPHPSDAWDYETGTCAACGASVGDLADTSHRVGFGTLRPPSTSRPALGRYVAGIRLLDDSPGYRHFRIEPRPGGGITWAQARHDSPYGRIESTWRLDAGALELSLTVPPGTTAEVALTDPCGRWPQVGTPFGHRHPSAIDTFAA
jgi:hypothetical protein